MCFMVILYPILSSENVFLLSTDMHTKAQANYQAIICSMGFVFWGIALLNVCFYPSTVIAVDRFALVL